MPYNERLAERVREIIAISEDDVEEKKMFGGMCFMVNGKMCVGIQKDRLMVRIDPGMIETLLEKDGCEQMTMGGKRMKGFILVRDRALTTKKKLEYWLSLALAYNPLANASKRKK